MRKMMKYCFLLLILVSCKLTAQDYKTDIRAALKLYILPKLQIDTKVDVYESYSATSPSQVFTAQLKKDGANYLSDAGDVRMLLNDNYLVMVYKAEKRVIYTKPDKKSLKEISGTTNPATMVDSLLAKNDSITYKGVKGQSRLYIIYSGKSMIRRTELYLDTQTGYITRLVYYYNEQFVPLANKVIINYTINTAPVFSPTEFSEKRFMTFKAGKAVAAGECSGYELIYTDPDNTTSTPEN